MTEKSPNGTPEMADEIDLMALVATLWRGKWWIALCAGIAILLGGYYAFRQAVPMYRSTAVVALETQEQTVVDIESVLSGVGNDTPAINTQVEVLRSRNLIEKLVQTLSLVEDPEFNSSLRAPNPYHPVVFVKSILGIENPERSEQQILDAVIDRTIRQISVSNIRNSLVFSISALTQDPRKSALVANTLAVLYIQDQLDEKFSATEKAVTWLGTKVAELKVDLEQSEVAVKDFNAGTKLVSLEALEGLSRQLKDMRDRLEGLEAMQAEKASRVEALRVAAQSKDPQTMASIADDARLDVMLPRLKNDPDLLAQFETRFAGVLKRAELDSIRATQQLTSLRVAEATLSEQIDSQSDDLVQLQQLQREAEANRLLYESFLSRLKETSVQQGLQKADSRMLSSAVPRPASSPRKGMILMLSSLLGIFAGAGLVLLNEMRHNAFRTSDELEAATGRSVIGTIPRIPGKARKDILEYVRSKPTSIVAEAVRNLRTSILLSNIDKPPQVIMSTSSVPGEGKTTQSLTLAQNMAGLGKKVLVMEGDIRRRIFAEYFDLKDRHSFLAVLAGDIPLEDAIYTNTELGVDILIAEQSSINAADLYSSDRFVEFLTKLRAKYDYIIIDTPPVLAVPDARVIGQHVDAIIYTVLWDETSKTQVKQGLAMFDSVGLKVSGLILGQVDNKQMKRYGYGGQYGYDATGSNYYDQ